MGLFEQALQSFFFPAFHELGDKVGGGIEAHVSALGTSGKRQGTDQVGFTGSRVSDQQDVFSFVQILPSEKLPNQRLIDRRLSAKVIGVDVLMTGKLASLMCLSVARFSRSNNFLSTYHLCHCPFSPDQLKYRSGNLLHFPFNQFFISLFIYYYRSKLTF